MSTNLIAAEILEKSAGAYARQASLRMETQLSGTNAELGTGATDWHSDALQRINDLIACLRIDQPDLFVEKALWLARAYAARDLPVEVPRSALISLRDALAEDFPETVAGAVLAIVDKALAALDQPLEIAETEFDTNNQFDSLALKYLVFALDGLADDGIRLIIEAIEGGISPQDAIARVIIPAQREVGEMWHRGEVSIAQEHLVSNTTSDLLAVIADRFAAKPSGDRKVVVASVAGNPHEVGVKATAALFRLAGWHTVSLGTDLPPNEIAGAVDYFNAGIVVLSAVLPTHMPAVRKTIEAVRQTNSGRGILVGGRTFDMAAGLWKEVGADAHCPGLESVVDMAANLLTAKSI
jgi:methanogenic corrinoid protein MtbC1